ncbi:MULTISPECIES: discoidin domain-containing protein [unclassified Streptomyces]|uniref:discoidin domain-containing protein n=1 Tax=unclassified Streptomyces TaxID=2593676 RepID=UPI002E80EBDC|nr:discoidin domain-containing protein [Streptomyces sp. NBC_00589]WTI36532.1 discoidin domain-containing protein [Streptomyces sp. NBC_00775]WUB29792.1 discoidin domain-containing protein [Streptomyces sp. NBC_00589]
MITPRRLAPLLAAALFLPLPFPLAPAFAAAHPPGCTDDDPTWSPTSTHIDAKDTYHPYVGNGYLGTRVPPTGTGYAATGEKTGWPLYTPRYDGTFVAGLYARGPQNTAGREALAALPAWTGLDIRVGDETYGARSRISHYRQTLSLRCGYVRTALTWTTPDGRRTDLTYDVLTARDASHTGAVRLHITPHWDGELTVTDRIDGRGARRLTQTDAGRIGDRTMGVAFRTEGTKVDGAVASTLDAPSPPQEADAKGTLSARQSSAFRVHSGRGYDVTKYVGIDTTLTAPDPRNAARSASLRAADRGWRALMAAHTAAWRALWSSDIEVPGHPNIQLWTRSAQYGLLSALRPGAADSIAPAGLTSDNYAGMVFWDAETWMFPSLLATRPDLARPVLDYRYRTRGAAADNARKTAVQGLFYPWTSASHGRLWSECQSWNPPHCVTQNHLQGDIALAAWQYYLATGDRAWLRTHGWPLLKGLAEYWSSRATKNSDGSYSIKGVAGPDEYSNGVDDGVYTNAVAATALRAATRAAALLAAPAPPGWAAVAGGLRMPYDPERKVFLQYAGYDGSQIKQADAVLLLYPLEWPMPAGAASATLDYYTGRTDPDGPAMTDSVHAIDAAAIGEPGCAAYTFLQRAYRPFSRGPFALFSEARGGKAGAGDALAGSPAQDFLTGKGGFLQIFTHGLTGLRLRENALHLDPVLPPQLADGGVWLSGLRWRGRTYDIHIGRTTTTVRLRSGAPFTLETPTGPVRLTGTATLRTRRPDLAPTTDLARCRPATATSSEPGLYPEAAVDGSPATTWSPSAERASLTVDLGRGAQVGSVEPTWTEQPASYTVEVSADGQGWHAPDGTAVRFVRVTVRGPAALAELDVRR